MEIHKYLEMSISLYCKDLVGSEESVQMKGSNRFAYRNLSKSEKDESLD
jgi:hypothetical protein